MQCEILTMSDTHRDSFIYIHIYIDIRCEIKYEKYV